MGEHSIIPPSSAAKRVQCPGSAVMEMQYPDTTETDEQREGTASHEVGEQMIRSFARGGLNFPKVGGRASNGVKITDAVYDGALMYAEECQRIMREAGVFGGENLRIEQRVHAPRIHPECWGTPDFALFDEKRTTLHVVDLKYGHRVVEAFENWQLIEYAVGVLDDMMGDKALSEHNGVVVRIGIVQPRAYHRDGPVRWWEIQPCDLRAYVNFLHAVEHEALGSDPPTKAGLECRDCSARHACETLQRASMEAIAYTGKPVSQQLSADALGLEIRLLRDAQAIIKARLDGHEAHAEAVINGGGSVPGWVLERGRGRQRWSVPADQVFQLGDMMGIDLRKAPTPVTPKQAITAGLDSTVVKEFSETPSTSPKLVESTKTKAAQVFGKPEEK